MHMLMNILVFTLLFNVILPVQGKNKDYLVKFFQTKDPNDLHENAKEFLVLWRSQQRENNDGYDIIQMYSSVKVLGFHFYY